MSRDPSRRPPLQPQPQPQPRLAAAALASLACAVWLAGCATPAIDEADRLARAGRYEDAYLQLDQALRARPDDGALRTAHARQRDRVVVLLLAQCELALAAGRVDEAERLVARASTLDAQQPRLPALQLQLVQARREQQRQSEAALAAADAARRASLAPPAPPPLPAALAAAYQKPVALEFREAPLRQVFETLARASGVNFVFDKDVRGDAKVTVFLRNVSLDEAMRVVLATQALDRKLLNDSTVLIYPNTVAKQREHQELVTRSLYLRNADARQVLALVRTMTKTRDLHADERLNALVLRDTPEVVRQAEQLIATLDLPEPEVLLAVEVMEVASNQLASLGLSWPTSVQYGLPGVSGQVALGEHASFRGTVANPALLATLRGEYGNTNLLANPTIRARNREKAKVQIGDKLPVFSTTQVVNGSVSTSVAVTYVDVGLKLDVEPTIQLDNEVTIKVALDVTNLVREVTGPSGATAYQVGQRLTTTTLRLKDGETQVLAGLISDEDRRTATGLPGLTQMPVLGRLFGVHGDTRNKNEVVMLITPRIVRRLETPSVAAATLVSGTDSQPGAQSLRLASTARVSVADRRGAPAAAAPPAADAGPAAALSSPAAALLQIRATRQARVGDTVSVTLANRSTSELSGELQFDADTLQLASAASGAGAGRMAFTLAPGGETVLVLRVLPAAAGQTLGLQLAGLAASGGAEVAVDGQTEIEVGDAAQAPPPPGAGPGQRAP
ncbi:secretin N-terminal domain-containing protein [Aquabacterium sp. OR-4]|uniref:secretin N-terminal domain-containing protein n=1 Tax=Aquabacterium sp. OR-4 TaxID=2978127 RepID=UPI0028CA39A4|nr:secretin N-terminal domain-containing protein [Aquabacterium sp. OR-4]MDT7838947.1 secretin N-terminal domain-containing protein [Aquabacterium sp. OR-4]